MFKNNWIKSLLPEKLLWKLTLVNSIVMALAMGLTGWAIYETACNLVGGIGSPGPNRQLQFNATLFQYFLIFTLLGIIISTTIQYYITRKLIRPIRELIQSTKALQRGIYPPAIQLQSSGEMNELIEQYNVLIDRLENNEKERKKLIENISHDLRTPTANMKGYLYALKEGHIAADPTLFHSLYQQADQLSKLIEQIDGLQLWDAAKEADFSREWIEVKQLIEESMQLFNWTIEQEGIEFDLAIENTRIQVNQAGMQQVLANLLDNAIRYRSPNSPIQISTYRDHLTYRIEIENEGSPLPADANDRIFDRFYRVDTSRNRKSGGSGLGLAIAKEIIMKHDGQLQMVSQGKKHRFIISLPLDERAT